VISLFIPGNISVSSGNITFVVTKEEYNENKAINPRGRRYSFYKRRLVTDINSGKHVPVKLSD
jgi:hypothetical protein